MKRAIVLKPNDEIEIVSFEKENYYSLKELVKAENENIDDTYVGFYRTPINFPCIDKKISFCYNDNFLVTEFDDFEKINALASSILEVEMRGNVVILISENDEIVGLNDMEIEIISKGIDYFKNQFLNEINQLHEEYDYNKAKPMYAVVRA